MPIRTGLTNEIYRGVRGWSKSDLDMIAKSPSVYEWGRSVKAVPSDSVELGTMLHCAILEPDEFPKLYAHQQAGLPDGVAGVKPVLWKKLQDMQTSVMANPTAARLLDGSTNEVSIFSSMDGTRVKCRPDAISKCGHMLVDLKKTADLSKFRKSVIDFRYHVQAAYYSDIYEIETGVKPRFIFIAVGERQEIGRHPVGVYELSSDLVDLGRTLYRSALDVAREYEAMGAGLDIEIIS